MVVCDYLSHITESTGTSIAEGIHTAVEQITTVFRRLNSLFINVRIAESDAIPIAAPRVFYIRSVITVTPIARTHCIS